MAVIKTGMKRPNIDKLFDRDILNSIELKITTAQEVLKNYTDGTFPVDPFNIATQKNIIIEEEELDSNISGKLIKSNDQYKIIVERRHSDNRKRFTMAHELAHYFLHKNLGDVFEDKVFFRGVATNGIEYQANKFASELLMPKAAFLDAIKQGKGKIEELSEFFGVSTLAVRVRAKQLGLSGHGL